MEYSRKRTIIGILCGVLAGFILLILVLGVLSAKYNQELSHKESAQDNLLAAGCYSVEGNRRIPVQLRVVGEAAEKCSATADGYFWFSSKTGIIELNLIPEGYTLQGSIENREVGFPVKIDKKNQDAYVLDVSLAPYIPEYTVFDLESEGMQEISIPKEPSSNIDIGAPLPEHITYTETKDELIFQVNTDQSSSYIPLRVKISNDYGYAIGFIGLRIPSKEEPIPISAVKDLQKIKNNPHGSFYLTQDLDLSSIGTWHSLTSLESPFTGRFDGRGHTISGLQMSLEENQGAAGFLGYLYGAQVSNLIFDAPRIQGASDEAPFSSAGVIAFGAKDSLITNCAVFGGSLSVKTGGTGGVVALSDNSHLLHLFNSADVLCEAGAILPNSGGIVGGSSNTYIAHCSNEGIVIGHHLGGGIVGFSGVTTVTKCINSGEIRGINLAAVFLPGGISQSSANGFQYHCYYVIGQSPVGTGGTSSVSQILPITWNQLRTPSELPFLFEASYAPQWAYASLNAKGPIPLNIFKESAVIYEPEKEGEYFVFLKQDKCVYFYTTDGSDPRVNGREAESLSIKLKEDECLKIFCASDGAYDSEVLEITEQGVRTCI